MNALMKKPYRGAIVVVLSGGNIDDDTMARALVVG